MIIKGGSAAGGDRLATHISRTDTNERMEVKEVRGVAAEDMRGAFREMEAVAAGCPNCKKPFYHASINTRADELLTPEQRMQAIDRLEKELGLTDQPRVVVVHEKEGREHCHVVWSRIDAEDMRTISDSHNYRKHEIVARELEREFGHARVQGAHIEREGKDRPARAPGHDEMQQAARTGIKPKQAREQITAAWRSTDNGTAFRTALEEKGWILANGDRRDFVAVDRLGGIHSLARRIEGAKAADVRARLTDIDPKSLMSAADAKEVQKARLSEREREAAQRRERIANGRLEAATRPSPRRERQASRGRADVNATRGAVRAADGIVKGFGKGLDSVANSIEGLFGGGPARDADGHPIAARENVGPTDPGPLPSKATPDELALQAEDDRKKRRQEYLRDFDREVPQETEHEAQMERDRRGRERTRGE